MPPRHGSPAPADSPLPSHGEASCDAPPCGDSPAWPGASSDCPVKSNHSTPQDACHRACETVLAFARRPSNALRLLGFRAQPAHPFAFCPPSLASVPARGTREGFRCDDFCLARSCPMVRLATCRRSRSRCVRPMTATQHSVNEHPYPASSRFIVPGFGFPKSGVTRWDAPTETEDSSVSRHPNRFGWTASSSGGRFLPFVLSAFEPLTLLSPPSLAFRPRLFKARLRTLTGCHRCGEGRQIDSTLPP